jgi:hypothetical protein
LYGEDRLRQARAVPSEAAGTIIGQFALCLCPCGGDGGTR